MGDVDYEKLVEKLTSLYLFLMMDLLVRKLIISADLNYFLATG